MTDPSRHDAGADGVNDGNTGDDDRAGVRRFSRRQGLAVLGSAGLAGLAGCSLRSVTDRVWPRWEQSLSATAASPPAATGDHVVVGGQDRQLHGFTADGTRTLRVETGGPVETRPAVPATGGPVHAYSTDGDLYTVTTDGERLWHVEGRGTRARLERHGSLVVVADRTDGTVTGYDATTGDTRFREPGGFYPPPVVRDGLCLLPAVDDAAGLVAVDPESGDRLWTADYGDVYATALNDKHVVTRLGETVRCHRARDGRLQWETTAADSVYSSLAVGDDRVYASAERSDTDDQLVVIDRESGEITARHTVGYRVAALTAADGSVFVGSVAVDPDGGSLIRLDAFGDDDSRLWTRATELASGGTVETLGRVGRLLYVANDGAVGAYDSATGERRWQYDPDAYRISVATGEETLFVSHRSTGKLVRLPVD